MATMWRKAMLYLGLGPEEEYDDYDTEADDDQRRREPAMARSRSGNAPAAPLPPTDEPSAIGLVRPINPQRSSTGAESSAPLHSSGSTSTTTLERPRPKVVRPVPPSPTSKPHVVVPTSFNQAQEVADKFKGNHPVIVNLQAADRDLARRLIDFASGLCYGLGGQMEKIANQVYLLTPSNVEVSAEERRRLEERGYDS